MTKLLPILPWAGLAVFAAAGFSAGFAAGVMAWAAPLALVLALAGWLGLRRAGRAMALHPALALYLALAAAAFWLAPAWSAELYARWALPLQYAVFTLFVLLPLLYGGQPFTEPMAKRQSPEAVWHTDVFRIINQRLSWAWAALFALTCLISLLPRLIGGLAAPWAWPLWDALPALALLLGVGAPLSAKYPTHYQRKLGLLPPKDAARPAPNAAPAAPAATAPHKEDKEMSDKPTVVAINGSPHEGIGNTARMIEMMRPTLQAEGFALEHLYVCQHEIDYCYGCGWCMEKGRCWIPDDHAKLVDKLLQADAVILGSPVYFFSVTGQMKTFLDRSLAFGHKPRATWKPGLAVSVSAGYGETSVAEYLSHVMRSYGAFPVGCLTAIATTPGGFLGLEAVQARAEDLARDLARAVKEKRRYPVTEADLGFWHFMKGLVRSQKDGVMAHDHKHWQEHGLYDSFEKYAGQSYTQADDSAARTEARMEWIKHLQAEHKARRKAGQAGQGPGAPAAASPAQAAPRPGPKTVKSLRELLEIMPLGLDKEAAKDVEAVYQFEVSGDESFTAHLVVDHGQASFHEGPADNPGVVVKTPADVWLAVSRGELNGQQAFMSGQYKAEGDIMLLMKLGSLFKG